MSTGQADRQEAGDKAAFETRDFTSPAFCAARATTSSTYAPKVVARFVFRDRPTRRNDVLAFYGQGAAVPPLAFSATIKDMKALLHNA